MLLHWSQVPDRESAMGNKDAQIGERLWEMLVLFLILTFDASSFKRAETLLSNYQKALIIKGPTKSFLYRLSIKMSG
jgi:hypothetical protein